MNPQPSDRASQSRASHDAIVDDIAIIQRMTERDKTALSMLYDRWVHPVYSLAVNMVRSADEAEDVVEETFWQIWQGATSYDATRGAVSTWILTIARSRALDRLRTRQRRQHDSLADRAAMMTELDAPNLSTDSERPDLGRAVVVRALHELPEEQRRVLELAHFCGLSQAEIAEYLAEPFDTVKMRMQVGMQKLRETLVAFRGEVA